MRPLWWEEAAAAEVAAPLLFEDAGAVTVLVNNAGIDEVNAGSVTPLQRDSTAEPTQHESVELGELAPQ